MGPSWRRVTEAVRQKVGITTDKTFKATTNSRNEAMFKEATDFSQHLRVMERDLRSMSKQVDGQFSSLRNILISPLPRAFDNGENGAVPLEEEPQAIGADVTIERITGAAVELKRRLETEVIQPVKEWLVAYRTIQDRMRTLETVRLELDSRRRTVGNLQGQFERMKSNMGSMGQNATAELENMEKKMNHKEEKMLRSSAQYGEMERTVYNSLFTLVRDTSVLREYTAAALQIITDCFNMAHSAYDALPAIEFSTTVANGFGAIASAAIGASADIDNMRYDARMGNNPNQDRLANMSEDGGDLDANERAGPYDQAPYLYDAAPAPNPGLHVYQQQQHQQQQQQSMPKQGLPTRDVRDTEARDYPAQPRAASAYPAPAHNPGPRAQGYNSQVPALEQQWAASRAHGY